MRARHAAVAIGLTAAALVATEPIAALAHNFVVSSTPEDGSTLTELPDRFVVTTNEGLLDLNGEGAGFVMQVRDDAGRYYGDGCVTVDGPGMSTPASLGAAGDYELLYQFVSADGHSVSGTISFAWQPEPGFAPAEGSPVPVGCDGAAAPSIGPTDPDSPATSAPPGDWLWILGGAVAVLIAVAVTAILAVGLRRRSE